MIKLAKRDVVKEVVNQPEPIVGEKKEEEIKPRPCGECKWYDHTTQREFHRDGIRKGLVEIRAMCRSPTGKARGHLVARPSVRDCFEQGVYVSPQKPEKKVKSKKETTQEQVKPETKAKKRRKK